MDIIKSVFFAFLLMQIIEYCIPNKSYVQYIKFYGGLMIIAMIASSVIELMTGTDWMGRLYNRFQSQLEAGDLKTKLEIYDNTSADKILKAYSDEISGKVRAITMDNGLEFVSCKVVFELDEDSEFYGYLKNISVSVRKKYGAKDGDSNGAVNVIIKNIQKEISDFYNLNMGNINVNIK